MRSALVSIVSPMEAPYMTEWIQWNINLGFDDLFIYCNNWRYLPQSNYYNVHFIKWNGKVQQLPAYYHAMNNVEDNWAMFLDADEFLDLRGRYLYVNQMFSEFNSQKALCFPWVLFGDSDLKFDNKNFRVIDRFTKCAEKLNKHVKCALNLTMLRSSDEFYKIKWLNPHCVNLTMRDVDGNNVYGPFNSLDVKVNEYRSPVIRHYFTKTFDEYVIRRNYGKADTPPSDNKFKRTSQEFKENNFNDVTYVQVPE